MLKQRRNQIRSAHKKTQAIRPAFGLSECIGLTSRPDLLLGLRRSQQLLVERLTQCLR